MPSKTAKSSRCAFRKLTLKQFEKEKKHTKIVDIQTIKYTPPQKKDMAIGLVYFNSGKSKRLLMNYLYTVEKLKLAEIPYYTIEMYEDSPDIADAIHLKTDFTLFQKERLCYLLEKNIPKTFTKLFFMDTDIIFENPNWYNEVSDKLDNFNIVQGYSKMILLDITYKKKMNEKVSFCLDYMNDKTTPISNNPGAVWGFQRDWYNKVGNFQYAIVGNGDRMTANCWFNINQEDFVGKDYVQPAIEEFKSKISETPKMCLLNSNVYHLWHGDRKNRQYQERHEIFKGIKDIRKEITVEENGLFTIKSKSLKKKIRKFFIDREDDGI